MGRPSDAVKHRFQRILEESGAYERFHKILKQSVKDENFLKAFDLASDRAFGKAPQFMDVMSEDVTGRPPTDTLIETITALRAELDSLRKGAELETEKREVPIL